MTLRREWMPVDKRVLKNYKKNQNELALIDISLDKLRARLEDVPVVSGKVTGSGRDFPYIEEHMTVKMAEPKEATALKNRIRDKEHRRKVLVSEIEAVEHFIEEMPDGIDKRVFEMVYLEGMTQKETAEMMGYTQSMVSKIISGQMKDS